MRVTKYIGARSCAADESKVLMLVPTFPGETVKNIKLSCYAAAGGASAIDQPDELNWYGIQVPWQLALTTPMLGGGVPSVLTGVPEYDALYKLWLRGATGDERFGGDANDDKEEVAGDEGHGATQPEELIESGPIGVTKFFTREVLTTPMAAEGTQTIRFGDQFSANTGPVPTAALGSILLFGMVRFEGGANTEFNVEMDDADAREAFGLLMGGDYTKVKNMIAGNTAALGDIIRTVLFGGDNYIEADTLKEDSMKAYVKAVVAIDGPLDRQEH